MGEVRTYYYARVSSNSQHADRQVQEFLAMGANERDIIVDKESGATLNRPGYYSLKNGLLRSGDTLVIKSLDRLSRNKADIKSELEYFRAHNIRVKVLDLPTTMQDFHEGQEWIADMVNSILIEVLATMSERERINIRTRAAEGIAAAKKKGVKFGRPSIKKPDNWDSVYQSWKNKEITAKQAMEFTGLKRTSFYKLVSAEQDK